MAVAKPREIRRAFGPAALATIAMLEEALTHHTASLRELSAQLDQLRAAIPSESWTWRERLLWLFRGAHGR